MVGYDMKKDKELMSRTLDFGKTKLIVSINSYDNGPMKVQLSRLNITEQGEQFSKLGRLNTEEVTRLIPVLQTMLGQMQAEHVNEEQVEL